MNNRAVLLAISTCAAVTAGVASAQSPLFPQKGSRPSPQQGAAEAAEQAGIFQKAVQLDCTPGDLCQAKVATVKNGKRLKVTFVSCGIVTAPGAAVSAVGLATGGTTSVVYVPTLSTAGDTWLGSLALTYYVRPGETLTAAASSDGGDILFAQCTIVGET